MNAFPIDTKQSIHDLLLTSVSGNNSPLGDHVLPVCVCVCVWWSRDGNIHTGNVGQQL